MGRNKLCVYKTCRSDSRYNGKEYMTDVFFIPFPKPKKNLEKCVKWLEWLGRTDYPISRVYDGTYLCSKHFVGGKGPTDDFPNPIHSQSDPVSILKPLNRTPPIDPSAEINSCEMELNTTTALNLNSLFENFTFHSDWGVVCAQGQASVIKLKTGTNLVIYGIKLDKDFNASYEVIGKRLNNPESLAKLPTKIDSQFHLKQTLFIFDACQPCSGNLEQKFLNEFEMRMNKRGFLSPLTGAIHHKECKLLLDKSVNRCLSCLKQRASFHVTISTRKKMNGKNCKKFSKISQNNRETKLRKHKVHISKMKAKVKKQENKICKQINEKGVEISEDDHNNLLHILEETVKSGYDVSKPEFSRLFLRTQLKMLKEKNKNRRRWDPLVLQWCLHMYAKSPSLYKSLNDSGVLILPSKSTLTANSPNIGITPGFHNAVFLNMKKDFYKIEREEHQKYFAIVMDEVKIQEDLIFRVETGDVVGYTTLGSADDKLSALRRDSYKDKPVASHVLQFMVRGLTTGFNKPFAHFATNCLNAERLDSLLIQAIQKLELIGFKVLAVVGDGASTNRKCFKFNCVDGKYKCLNPFARERDIYFISDVPHLIKTVRNCLANSKEATNSCRLMNINGETLTWSTIRDLYNEDLNKPGNLRKLHKLGSEHIQLENRMKVKLATQVLSQSVANALQMEYGEKCKELTRFICIFNKWFDILNVGHLMEGYHTRNPNVKPFRSVNDWRLQWLKDDFLGYLREWENYVGSLKVKDDQKKKMQLSQETLFGLRLTTNSVLEIVPFLLAKGAKFVLTAHLNQDPLEQLFSKHRQSCRAGCNPNVYQY